MDLKLIDDLAALRRCGSFVRAAEERHITHPAFGRRIRSLEAWAGVALVEPGRAPVKLTAAGVALLAEADTMLGALQRVRAQWLPVAQQHDAAAQTLRIGTGRTLAHTLVTDWLGRMRKLLRGHQVVLQTNSMAAISAVLEQGEIDLLCCYEHPALSVALSAQRFRHLTLARDRLVPVSRVDASGRLRHALDSPQWVAYAPQLALGRLLQDHLAAAQRRGSQPAPSVVCDSVDAMLQLALKGLGLAWLPLSLTASHIKQGLLKPLGGLGDQVHYEVRLYRPKARQSPLLEAVWAATAK